MNWPGSTFKVED